MENIIKKTRERILPILLFCQANKGDLSIYEEWKNEADAAKKKFYAYYSGLFCRILFYLEIDTSIIPECLKLLDKYNWYNLQPEDINLFKSAGTRGCEIPKVLTHIPEIDDVVWKNSGFGNRDDAVCLREEHGCWTFADVRG